MVPQGLQEASCAIIGNEIGANNVRLARRYYRVISTIVALVAIAISLAIYFCREQVTGLFTKEPTVFNLTVQVMPILAILHLADELQGYSQGQIRALGLQRRAAFIALGSYYLIAIPLACIFAFVFEWGLAGLWVGQALGNLVQGVLYLRLVLVANWQ